MTNITLTTRPVYPGHPVTIGVQIMRCYPSLTTARSMVGRKHPAAIADGRIAGAVGNVYAALRFLGYAFEVGPDRVIEHSKEYRRLFKDWKR